MMSAKFSDLRTPLSAFADVISGRFDVDDSKRQDLRTVAMTFESHFAQSTTKYEL